MAKKATKAPTLASLAKEIHELRQQVQGLMEVTSAQAHIQSPEDGDPVLQNFSAAGAVRPKTHQVRCVLTRLGESSVVTPATVNPTTGNWTAGPFRKQDGSFLSPGPGATLTADSYTTGGMFADHDEVTNLTIQ